MIFQEGFSRPRLEKRQIKMALDAVRTILKAQKPVSFAYLHGSVLHFLSNEQALAPHDLDLAIYLSSGDFLKIELDMQLDFYRLTGIVPELLDVHSLNGAPLWAAMKILGHGTLFFCRDDLQHADFIEKVSNTYRRMADLFEAAHG
jgi:hypothetical protein